MKLKQRGLQVGAVVLNTKLVDAAHSKSAIIAGSKVAPRWYMTALQAAM